MEYKALLEEFVPGTLLSQPGHFRLLPLEEGAAATFITSWRRELRPPSGWTSGGPCVQGNRVQGPGVGRPTSRSARLVEVVLAMKGLHWSQIERKACNPIDS